jgi:hypothetical protein
MILTSILIYIYNFCSRMGVVSHEQADFVYLVGRKWILKKNK